MTIDLNDFINHYKVLGVSQNATRQEITNAYKKLCLVYHPDKPTGDAVMFEQINDSYLVLKNPVLKQQYDLSINTDSSANEFDAMRKSFKEYIKTPDNFIPKPDESQFVPINVNENKIKPDENVIDDINLIREQDDLENLPEKLFDEVTFDPETFNDAFDKIQDVVEEINKKSEKKFKDVNYEDLFAGSCRATNLDSTFNTSVLPSQNDPSEFLNQFAVARNIKSTRNTNDSLDEDYFKKLLEDRDNILDTIEYSNVIDQGIDYKAIGFIL